MSDEEIQEVFDSSGNSDENSSRGRGARGRTRYRGRFPRRGDGTFRGVNRPFRGTASPRRFRPPRRPFQSTSSSTSRGGYGDKSTKKDSYHHERHRSDRRSRSHSYSRSRSRSTSRERRDRHYRSRRSRSRSRSRSHSRRSRSRSRSQSPLHSTRRSSPSRSRSSPSRHTRQTLPPRGAYIPKTSRYYLSPTKEPVESPSTSSIVPKFRLEEQSRLTSRDKSDHQSPSPADPLESLRITVSNDYFGPTSQAREELESGRNNWDRNRDDAPKEKEKISSLEPLWKIDKVMGPRDMDAFDDDVHHTRIASRASPPPPSPPNRSLSPKPDPDFTSKVKQEVTQRTGDVSFFSKISQSQSWDWSQTGSAFLEETPKRRDFSTPKPDLFSGFGSSHYNPPDVKVPLRSCLRKTDLPSAIDTVKQESRAESPPVPKYNIPGLDLVNSDDVDEFLYGDADDGDKEINYFSGKSKQHVEDRISARNDSRPEQSSVQEKDSHATLSEYLKRIGLGNKLPAATTGHISEDAQERALEIAKRVAEMFSTPRVDSTPASEEKLTDSRPPTKSKQASDPSSSQTVPVKPDTTPSYSGFGTETVGNYRSNVPASSELNNSATPALAAVPMQYPNYQQQQSAPASHPASYAQYNQYDQPYYAGMPAMVPPGIMPPYPGHGQAMQHFAMPQNSAFQQGFPQPAMPTYPPYPMATPTTTAPAAPGWVSSLTPVQTTPTQVSLASRSNLKVIELQGERSATDTATTSKTAVASSAPGPKVEELKTPTSLLERKKLLQEKLETKKRLDIMNSQVEDCRKRQGELLRRKQRQKDGHNDPHLAKLAAAQELYSSQIAPIKKKLDSIEKALKSSEFLIRTPLESSGSSPSRNASTSSRISAETVLAPKEISNEKPKESIKYKSSSSTSAKYRYVDNGNHWCKHCRDIFKLATDLLKHLHTKHLNVMERLAPADRPWASKPQESISASANLMLQPFQGVEFMLPSQAFYCSLCCEFSGDLFEARNHLESEKHNLNHNKYCHSNPNYQRRVQAERASSLVRKKDENRRKLAETLQDNKRKIEDSLLDIRPSRHSKSTFKPRRRNSTDSDDSDEYDDSSKKTQSSTRTNIKINFLKKEKESCEPEENDKSSFTISTPQSKIPFKLMGKGVSTSLTNVNAGKKPAPVSMEDQRAQRILSNLKKRRIQDKSERSEPLPLEDFVSIALESGLPSDCKLPDKDVQTIMAAAKELRVTPKFLAKPSKKEYGPHLPPTMEIGPQLPLDVEILEQVSMEETVALYPPVEPILAPPLEEGTFSEPQPPGVEDVQEPLPPGVKVVPKSAGIKCIRQPPLGSGNTILPPPSNKVNLQLPTIITLDNRNHGDLSDILDTIPLPQELDDFAKKMEESGTTQHEEIEEVEMQDVDLVLPDVSNKPNDSVSEKCAESMDTTTDAENSCINSANNNSTCSTAATTRDYKPSAGFDEVLEADIGKDSDVLACTDVNQPNDELTLVIDSVTSLANDDVSEMIPNEGDVEMTESTSLSTENVEAQADQEHASRDEEKSIVKLEQVLEPTKDADVLSTSITYDAVSPVEEDPVVPLVTDAVIPLVTDAVIPNASQSETDCSSQLPEEARPDSSNTTKDTNGGSDLSTDAHSNSSKVEQLQLERPDTDPAVSLSPKEDDDPAASSNGQPKAIDAGGTTTWKRPQLAICSRGRGRGRGRGGARPLPSCSVVINQEIVDAAKLKIQSSKGTSDASSVAVTTPRSAGKNVVKTTKGKKLGGKKISKLKVRVKQEVGAGENDGSQEKNSSTVTEEESSIAVEGSGSSTNTSTEEVVEGEVGNASFSDEKLDDALLEDDNVVGLPPSVSEAEEKLDDTLLNEPDSDPIAGDEPQSDVSIGNMEVIDEA